MQIKMSSLKRLWYNTIMKAEKTGFTLVELSISLVFVSVLLLAIVFVINNTVMAYRRGNTLGQINTIGMDLVDDLRMAVQDSSAKTLTGICFEVFEGERGEERERAKCEDDGAYNFVSVTKYEYVTNSGGGVMTQLPIYGVFCSGTYSYIWNSGYFESEGATFAQKSSGTWLQFKYKNKDGAVVQEGVDKPIRLMKVLDPTRSVCLAAVYKDYSDDSEYLQYTTRGASTDLFSTNVINITKIADSQLTEDPVYLMASGGENNLAIYDLMVSRPALST